RQALRRFPLGALALDAAPLANESDGREQGRDRQRRDADKQLNGRHRAAPLGSLSPAWFSLASFDRRLEVFRAALVLNQPALDGQRPRRRGKRALAARQELDDAPRPLGPSQAQERLRERVRLFRAEAFQAVALGQRL